MRNRFGHFIIQALLALVMGFSAPLAWALHVVLDPGHGGSDRGTSHKGVTESEITLKVSQLIAEELKSDGRFRVTLTRQSDTYLSLEDRVEIANKNGDVFLSIHVNSSPDPDIRGQEIYFQNQLPPDEESLFLASRENMSTRPQQNQPRSVSLALKGKPHLNSDVRAIIGDLERNHRFKLSSIFTEKLFYNWLGDKARNHSPIRQAPFFVVSNVEKPAALIEIGYLTNKHDAARLTDPAYQKKIAKGIYKALLNFKEFIDKPIPKSLD